MRKIPAAIKLWKKKFLLPKILHKKFTQKNPAAKKFSQKNFWNLKFLKKILDVRNCPKKIPGAKNSLENNFCC